MGKCMIWVPVEEALPKDGQAVLVRRIDNNWHTEHTLADGTSHDVWRWVATQFVRGRTKEYLAENPHLSQGGGDEIGNNLRPYHWRAFGGGDLFGQDVSHWSPISDPYPKQGLTMTFGEVVVRIRHHTSQDMIPFFGEVYGLLDYWLIIHHRRTKCNEDELAGLEIDLGNRIHYKLTSKGIFKSSEITMTTEGCDMFDLIHKVIRDEIITREQ